MILGIWDGHDSGAALIDKDKILFAVNEERLSRRKLEVCFPKRSINFILKYLNLEPLQIKEIAYVTYDFAKTITRILPDLKENYYLSRRRKIIPLFPYLQKEMKFFLTGIKGNFFTKTASSFFVGKELKKLGFRNFNLDYVNHHAAHAYPAAFLSRLDPVLIITIDGVGDGLSGSFWIFKDGNINRMGTIPARDSLGVFFESVTFLLNMRELEDEGKVMALANYSYPLSAKENEMLDLFRVEGIKIKAKYTPGKTFRVLKNILWKTPPEQFAYMAQNTLEEIVLQLMKNLINHTGLNNISLSGGVFANVKLNMRIRRELGVNWFVYPHMGDGGLALGAAMVLNYAKNHIKTYDFKDLFLGPEYPMEKIEDTIKNSGLKYKKTDNHEVAKLISQNEILLYFQGRMEFGPRALGNRSILAAAGSVKIKDKLNLILKRRSWYQPFCPAILREDAERYLEDYDGNSSDFMTMAYKIRPEVEEKVKGVIGYDMTCRPQIINDFPERLRKLMETHKKITGEGVILNTSFNRHGESIVCTPEEAIVTMKETGINYMVMGDFLIANDNS